jgi:PAS domain S-box-containing protein
MKRTADNKKLCFRRLFPVIFVQVSSAIVRMAVVSVLFVSMFLILPAGMSQARDAATVQHSNPTSFPATSLKTIIVGDYYPYTFVNDKGIPDGFSVDIAKACVSVMDRKLEITVDTWENATKALANGTIDLLPMMAASPVRDRLFDFSVPHTIAYDAVFFRSGVQRVRSLNDLVGKTVIVMNKDAAHDYLLSSGMADRMKLVLVDSLPDALRTLAAGKGDAALMPKLVGLIVMKKLNLTNLDPSAFVIDAYNRPFCFAVKHGNQALLERLSQGLSIIKSTGQYQEIYKKWFGALEPTGLSWETVIKYIGAILVIFLLIGSGLILWTVSLRKQVSLRTKKLAVEIQERKQAEEALREGEEKYRTVADFTYAWEYWLAPDGRYLYVSPACERISGYRVEEFQQNPNLLERITHPDDRHRLSVHIRDVLQGKSDVCEMEFRIITRVGKECWISHICQDVYNPTGEYLGRRSSNLDITERKQAEEALRESEVRYRTLIETTGDLIYTTDKKGFLTYMNPTLERTMGYAHHEWNGQTFARIVAPEYIDSVKDHFKRAMKGESIPVYETDLIRKDGKRLSVEFNASTIYDNEGKPAGRYGIGRDITDRKRVEEEKRRLEERLQRAEKMEALGTLAGGVAHDLNNVLGVLSGYSELLLMEIPEGNRSRGHVEKILQSTEKGAAIIQDLLTLARRGVAVSDVINLNSIVSGFLKTPVFEKIKDYHPRVTFKTECDKNLLNITGSPLHLEKTLMNLVSNAAESISGEGTVTIRTESRYLDKPLRGYDEIKEGNYTVMTVSDTGMGIPAENKEKIFEPFYTKKTMGRSGTGLGLAIVWGTVKDHNGYIDVQTEVGQGTTFTLYFPVTSEELMAPQQKETVDRYMGKGESVLVVDDIAEQRDIAARLITQLGYEVHVVSSGEEAVKYLRGNRADILVLDMIMAPGIDGLETYQRVLKINPKQKAILVSGFSETDRVKEAQKLGAGAYVKKPYVMEKIGVAIRDELNR